MVKDIIDGGDVGWFVWQTAQAVCAAAEPLTAPCITARCTSEGT